MERQVADITATPQRLEAAVPSDGVRTDGIDQAGRYLRAVARGDQDAANDNVDDEDEQE